MESNTLGGLVPAAILLCLFSNGALAQQRPAVSGLNGKFEFSAGVLTLPTPSFVGRAAGALTVPLGDRFGLQADFSVSTSPGYTISAALHAFTRDPSDYLFGASAGFVKSAGALVIAAGPEAELYRDRWTIEAWAGASMVDPAAPGPTRFGVFALGTLAYYPTDNWRVSVGVSSLDNYAALQVGSEYLLDGFDVPVAITGEARLGQDGAVRALVGLRGYVGPDPHKSLIDRQREDDPPDLGSALYGAAGKSTLYGEAADKPQGSTASGDAGSTAGSGDQSQPPSSGGGTANGGEDEGSGKQESGSGGGGNPEVGDGGSTDDLGASDGQPNVGAGGSTNEGNGANTGGSSEGGTGGNGSGENGSGSGGGAGDGGAGDQTGDDHDQDDGATDGDGGDNGAGGSPNDGHDGIPDWCMGHATTVAPSWISDASNADGGICQDSETFEIYHKSSV